LAFESNLVDSSAQVMYRKFVYTSLTYSTVDSTRTDNVKMCITQMGIDWGRE